MAWRSIYCGITILFPPLVFEFFFLIWSSMLACFETLINTIVNMSFRSCDEAFHEEFLRLTLVCWIFFLEELTCEMHRHCSQYISDLSDAIAMVGRIVGLMHSQLIAGRVGAEFFEQGKRPGYNLIVHILSLGLRNQIHGSQDQILMTNSMTYSKED